MTTWKQIEASREARLWTVQVVIPVAAIVTGILAVPDIRKGISTKINKAKERIKNKLKKD